MPGINISDNAQARATAIEKTKAKEKLLMSPVGYQSQGRLLIIGASDRARPIARKLSKKLKCTIAATDETSAEENAKARNQYRTLSVPVDQLSGFLGAFEVLANLNDNEENLATTLGEPDGFFDLILDMQDEPLLATEILPPGYFAPISDADLERVVDELPGLIGEFEKPKYFNYNPDICAHGNSKLTGCTRCIDACPTEAIISIGDKVEVDPHLCQGGGSCATVCPSGAMTFVYPPASDTLNTIRALVRHYREAGGQTPIILFHDAMQGRHLIEPIKDNLPGHVLTMEIEEIGAVGMDVWLSAMAYGFNHTLLLMPSETPSRVKTAINDQLAYAKTIIEGIGYSGSCISTVIADEGDALIRHLNNLSIEPDIHPATFSGDFDKRTTLRMAIDHLYQHSLAQTRMVPLPYGAPFGEINVQQSACTLCMACVSVCPTSALSDGNDIPQLRFDEWNCVQCGLCEKACPEDAISLSPRFLYDPEVRRRTRVLNEDEPFCCVVCGKPFATHSVMKNIANRLKDHYMYQTSEAKRRLQMCEDCRVRDMFQHEASL